MGKSSCSDNDGLKKGPWTGEEDEKLIEYIQKHGQGKWRTLPKNAGLKRCGKSCRLRWTNYLRPDIKRGQFSIEEEDAIIQLHRVLGNKWSAIAARLPGRTDNEIKNYWNTHIKKKLLKMGIDPVTHSPCHDLFHLSSILSSCFLKSLLQPDVPINSHGVASSTSNPGVLGSAATLLSNLNKNNNIQENPNQYFLPNQQLTPLLNIDQANFDSLSTSLLNSQGSLTNLPQNNDEYPFPSINHGYNNLYHRSNDQAISDPWAKNSHLIHSGYNFEKNIESLGFASLLSAGLSSSTTPLRSSSAVYVNGGSEHERDSFCGNAMIFDNPSGLNIV